MTTENHMESFDVGGRYTGGLDKDLILDLRIRHRFTCGICDHIVPGNCYKVCSNNFHVFCVKCHNEYLKSIAAREVKYECPFCQDAEVTTKIPDANMIARTIALLNSSHIKCPTTTDITTQLQCPWLGPLSLAKNHLDHVCQFVSTQCPDCAANMLRIDLVQHLEVCPNREVLCNNIDCQWSGQFSAMTNHLQEECLFEMIKCKQCETSTTRKEMDKHVKDRHFIICSTCELRLGPNESKAQHQMKCQKALVPCEYYQKAECCPLCAGKQGMWMRRELVAHYSDSSAMRTCLLGVLRHLPADQDGFERHMEGFNNNFGAANDMALLAEGLKALASVVRQLFPPKK
jgi:hypothetical protein